jgi:predicted nucleic acid-binding Zn ribbon protein
MKVIYKDDYVHKRVYCPECGKFINYDNQTLPEECNECGTKLER